ncbi:MAG: gamma-glutamylcyclotransferase [Acetivibrionales bacterium]
MDKFFIQENCDRCGKSLNDGRIMSMYNTQCICLECKKKEMHRADYKEAADAELEEVKKGNYNYKGIEEEK